MKLPYNLSDNPYDRATKFLGDNELPISYLDSVANFITENTKGATMGQQSQPAGADPLGTEARYRPGESQSKNKYLPHAEYVSLTQAKFEPIQKKILSLNKSLIESGNKHLALNPSDESVLADLIKALNLGRKSLDVPQPALDLVLRIILEWPYSDRLAGLDLFRCVVQSPTVTSYNHPTHGSVVDIVLDSALQTEGAVNENHVMMALRTLTNLFATAAGQAVAAKNAPRAVEALARIAGVDGNPIGAQNRNVQIALTSTAFNYSVLNYNNLGNGTLAPEVPLLVVNILARVLHSQSDAEVLYRALMAVGMILATGKNAQKAAKELEIGDVIQSALQKSSEERVKDVAQECLAYLR